MLSRSLRHSILLLPASAFLLLLAQSAHACTCGPTPSLLEAFDYADEVVILRVVSVEKVENKPPQYYAQGIRSTTMVVEKVFKGNLKVSEQIVFGQGGGGDCIWMFSEKSVGNQLLMYLQRPDRRANDSLYDWIDPSFWLASTCGRSDGIDGADLLYLEKMSKVKGKTRISGSLDARTDSDLNLEGKTVKIIGPNKVYKTKTNKNGVFEIYDLPPGNYVIEPEVQRGWKLDPVYARFSLDIPYDEYVRREREWKKRVEVTLGRQKHAEVEFRVEPDNFLRGTVLGPKGTPMSGVCVNLLRRGEDTSYEGGCTDEEGRFEITSIPKGDYVLVANQEGKLSTRVPFRKIFYPNVAERERAAVISIAPGQTVADIDLVIAQLEETITIEGVLRYSDGKPVVERMVRFEAAQKDDKVDAKVLERTDAEGRFTLTVLKGVKGELFAEYYLISSSFKNCPKVDELIAKSGDSSVNVSTNKIKLTAEQNLYDVELTLPFPLCEKK